MKNPICELIYEGKTVRGEYTGYSEMNNKHHISLYDGRVVKLDSMKDVKIESATPEQIKEMFLSH